MSTLINRLKTGKPLLLDGATGTELEKRGVKLDGKLWSGTAVLDDPTTLQQVYQDYIDSGSDMIETATYQLSKKGLIKHDLDPHQTYQKAIDIADKARKEQQGKDIYVVGSVGPYGAFLADGSEYTGRYPDFSVEKLKAFHFDRLEYLYKSRDVDMIGFETIPSFDEVKALLELMKSLSQDYPEIQKPYYLSLSCNEYMALADGTSLHKVLEHINKNMDRNLVAIGANCCSLHMSKILIEKLDLEFGNFSNIDKQCKIVIYPNSGEVYNGAQKTWMRDEKLGDQSLDEAFKEAGQLFVSKRRLGIVGGCCRTGPSEIKILRGLIDKADN